MHVSSPYNLSALLPVLGLGALLACFPLYFALMRQRQRTVAQRNLALTGLILFLTFDLILVGSFTRLSDSGLGCPDWPGCYGHASPTGAMEPIQEQQDQMPTGPVTHQKAWIEMLHRYLATAVGGLILVSVSMSLLSRLRSRRLDNVVGEGPRTETLPKGPGVGWPMATLVWVCLQGAFGALTVTMRLFPGIVSMHLLGSYVLLGMLVVQVVLWSNVVIAERCDEVAPTPQRAEASRWGLLLGLCLVITQACSGAWVSANYAVLACQDFPTCQGGWWPPMDFVAGFEIWHPLGLRGDGRLISFQALTAIHFFHRLLAALTATGLIALAWHLHGKRTLTQPARWLIALLCLQLLTGIANVVLGWPTIGALMHTAGAGGLVAVLVWMITISGHVRTTNRFKDDQ